MQYHIIEIQRRPDGINNVLEIVSRNTLATGLSYYYDRCSKMAANTQFVSVTLVLIDSDGAVIENKKLPTAYVPEE
jgi:hypothetical protein